MLLEVQLLLHIKRTKFISINSDNGDVAAGFAMEKVCIVYSCQKIDLFDNYEKVIFGLIMIHVFRNV